MIHTGADDLRSWMVDCCSFWKISLQLICGQSLQCAIALAWGFGWTLHVMMMIQRASLLHLSLWLQNLQWLRP